MHILRWHCDLRWFTSFIEECLKNLIFQWNRQMYILYFLFCLKKSQQCFFRMYFASFFFTNPWMTLNAFWQISFRKHSTSAMLGNPRLGQANHGEAAQQAAGLVVSAFTWKCLNQDAVSITPCLLKSVLITAVFYSLNLLIHPPPEYHKTSDSVQHLNFQLETNHSIWLSSPAI